MNKNIKLFAVLTGIIFLLWSCVKQDFDVPPVNGLSDLVANTTIAEIKAMHNNGSTEKITTDLIISGIMISDDKAGNFYKTMMIQDETGGIEIRVDGTNLNVDFPRGRRVFVKCNGLTITDYNSFIQLSYNGERIPSALMAEFLERGDQEAQQTPKDVELHNLKKEDVGSLVRISSVEVSKADNGSSYADTSASAFSAKNVTIEDCIGNVIILRNSKFADFAANKMPEGNGTLTGILSIFRSTYQILIRDEADMNMPNDPCNRSSGNADLMTIKELKDLFTSGSTAAPDNKRIEGIIISDADNSNITNKNFVIQDGSAGITVRFTAAHSFQLNDKVNLEVSGMTLDEFNGLLQVNNVPLGNASKSGTGNITAVDKTIAEVLADFESYESTLVRFTNVKLSGGSTFNGNLQISDGSGELVHFTTNYASFANDKVPTNEVVLTGIISQGGDKSDKQILIRNLSDIIGGNGGGGGGSNDPKDSFTEDFSSFTDKTDIAANGWTSNAIKGTRKWQAKDFKGNLYAQASAFNDTEPSMETMLFTPPLKLDKAKKISFQSAMGFVPAHDGLTVWISTNYDGKDYASATWTQLSGNFANKDSEEHTFIDSGDIDLSAYSGVGYIGFKYIGDGGGNTSAYRIDNVVFGDK